MEASPAFGHIGRLVYFIDRTFRDFAKRRRSVQAVLLLISICNMHCKIGEHDSPSSRIVP